MIKYNKSIFEKKLDEELLRKTSGKTKKAVEFIINNKPLEQLMQFCNIVSIERLSFNDHGRVHTKMAALNAIKFIHLLNDAGVMPNIVKEEIGDFDDACLVVVIAALLHDLGMSVGRENHEFNSVKVGDPFILDILRHVYDDEGMIFILRSVIFECIMGHMGHMSVSSIESGILLISDGCDMEKGRARITTQKRKAPHVGDIHAYSAMSVSEVEIQKGTNKPIEIFISMKDATGIFQVEEILMGKINKSAVKPYIELCVKIADGEKLYYLN